VKDFLRDCGPGRVCPAYRAGKFPQMCCFLKKQRAELRLAVLICIAIMTLTAAIVAGTELWVGQLAFISRLKSDATCCSEAPLRGVVRLHVKAVSKASCPAG